MSFSITSANSAVSLVVPLFYPGGITLEDYSTDSLWDIDSPDLVEVQMSADGNMHAGKIFNPTNLTFTFSAASPTCPLIDNWVNAQNVGVTAFQCSGNIIVPDLGRQYTIVNAVILNWHSAPPGGRVLSPRALVLACENVVAGNI